MTQVNETTGTLFSNILNLYIKKIDTEQTNFSNFLNEQTTIEDIMKKWQFKNHLTKVTLKKNWTNIEELKSYIYNRRLKEDSKVLDKFKERLNTIEKADEVKSITIVIEWKKSAMWGNNPQAEVQVNYKNIGYKNFTSSRVGGAGYCKESTAFAEGINQVNGILKEMAILKNANISRENKDIFGYGAGYSELPRFEGGVGVESYYRIFEKIGYKMTKKASGKTFDVWEIVKNESTNL